MVAAIFHSAYESGYLWLPLAGFIIGFAASMTGSGGGFFFLPVLILFFHVPAQVAVATSLAATLPICIAGSLSHYRHGHIDSRLGALFAGAGIAGAVTGAVLTNHVSSALLKTGFGIYALLMAVPILMNYWKRKRTNHDGQEEKKAAGKKETVRGGVYGFIAGMVAGAFGTSGAAPVLAGLLTMRIPVKLVVGTSLMIVLVNTFFALGTHFMVGEVDLTLVLFLAAGSGLGAYAGAKLLSGIRVSRMEGPVRLWYAVGLIVLGMVILFSR